ncbi:DUF6969 family protein [Cupriavidus necator]|uniref:DUF6969 family protein n=1 Tax=Cupriavidus necator TaxID=106590 RepID=UPI003F49B00C
MACFAQRIWGHERGESIALAALAGSRNFVDHYPATDIREGETGAIAYYHAHAATKRKKDEHRHFHVFVPNGIRSGRGSGYSHLAGISVTARGEALRLFTTNRWVTEEDWLPARQIDTSGALVDCDDVHLSHRYRGHCWRSATPSWRDSAQPWKEAALEDSSIHIVTEKPVNVPECLLKIEAEFNAR